MQNPYGGFPLVRLRDRDELSLALQKECVKLLQLEPEAKDKSEALGRQSHTSKNKMKYKDTFKPVLYVFGFVN